MTPVPAKVIVEARHVDGNATAGHVVEAFKRDDGGDIERDAAFKALAHSALMHVQDGRGQQAKLRCVVAETETAAELPVVVHRDDGAGEEVHLGRHAGGVADDAGADEMDFPDFIRRFGLLALGQGRREAPFMRAQTDMETPDVDEISEHFSVGELWAGRAGEQPGEAGLSLARAEHAVGDFAAEGDVGRIVPPAGESRLGGQDADQR